MEFFNICIISIKRPMEETNAYRKQAIRNRSIEETQLEEMRNQLAVLEARNKKLERELMEREEIMQSMFSFIQDKNVHLKA